MNYGGYASDYVVDYDYLVPIPADADLARWRRCSVAASRCIPR
ncbi:MAG: hypothetical protein CM15mP103_01830 [Gammaproteobacteria bacterium]|nr:MAG: hypothetical protein CM15mP103_01830 [Gammaproteobacteria bacterium]